MPVVNSEQEEQRAQFDLFQKLYKLPPPQHPHANFNPKDSPITTLMNAFTASGSDGLRWKETSRGEAHTPFWTVSVFVDEKEYGHAESRRKSDAKEQAAEQALKRLQEEHNPSLEGNIKYLPIFRDYLKMNKLEASARYDCTSSGPDHARRWNCILYLDGVSLGFGGGQKKQLAMEEAARDAASNWPRPFESPL